MKNLSSALFACLVAGCATNGDVEKVSGRMDAVEDRQIASDKAVNGMIQHVEQLERELKALSFRMGDLQKKMDSLSPPSRPMTGDDIERALNNVPMDPETQQKFEAYLKELPTLPPEKALELAAAFEKKDVLIHHFVRLIRNPAAPSRPNAIYILTKLKPADAAPTLEPYLSDGSVRGELLKIMGQWEPNDITRQALLKHATEGTEAWRVMLADALARAECRDGIKTLIQFLYSPDMTIRTPAIEGLKWATGFDLGYKTYSSTEERRTAAEKWEAWWKENEAKFEFPRH